MFRKTSFDSLDSKNPISQRRNKEYYDYLCKTILVGPSGCGKSSILHRFVKGEWNVLTSQTIGVEFSSKIIDIGASLLDSVRLKLQLWDTAGQERFRSLTRSYYRASAGVLLVYDITSKETNKVDLLGNPESIIESEIVHNEINDNNNNSNNQDFDTSDARQTVHEDRINTDIDYVPMSHALAFCEEYSKLLETDIQLVYASALTNTNITEIFERLGDIILNKIESGILNPEDTSAGIQYGELPFDFNGSIGSSSSFNISRHTINVNRHSRQNKNSEVNLLYNRQGNRIDRPEEQHGWSCC
ncbi:unnamed protein product [[Candida] boidinii]|nr:unnamed protein product [[Candida] boidinii]